MAVTRTPFIAGNWKMNLDHLQAIAFVQKLAWSLSDAKHDFADAEVAVFPPFTDLRSVQTLVSADDLPIAYGAQDLSQRDSGAYTGEVSGAFLAKLDCRYVIIGHSERRTLHGETDEVVNAKVVAAHRHRARAGALRGRDRGGPRAARCERRSRVSQLRAALEAVDVAKGLVVAYEPVWAIGSGGRPRPSRPSRSARRFARSRRACRRRAGGRDGASSTAAR